MEKSFTKVILLDGLFLSPFVSYLIYMKAYDQALSYLSRREHTVKELAAKLSAKGYGNSEIDEVLALLQKQNFQSDRRFAEAFIRSRLNKCPEGRPILQMRLVEKGVSKSLAGEVLDEYFEEHEEEIGEIYSEYQKSLERKKGAEKARSTLIRKGIRRGFMD